MKEERRSCSKVKPWIYFLLELTIYSSFGAVIGMLVGGHFALPAAVIVIVLALYKTKAISRLERVLERTDDVRKTKIKQRYEAHI